ncbi:hypothetical protein [Microbacterium sp. P05]|uniref:hypothetical protein n=1 Tax=Microbacterium sp. P05 TaxID=3366948 RepID=UPI00374533EE
MSDLVIRGGSVVEVDTAALRDVARRLRAIATELNGLRAHAAAAVEAAARASATNATAMLEATLLRSAVETAEREAEDLADRVASAATLYETVELLISRATAAGDVGRLAGIDARLLRLTAEDPLLVAAALRALAGAPTGHDELYRQARTALQPFPVIAPPWLVFPMAFGTVDLLRLGPVAANARLTGGDVPVEVRATASAPVAAPKNLAEAAARIPTGEARIRVERLTMPDGSRQFAVYVAGTRSGGANEPFDMDSNVQLYSGVRSASYAAVLTALRDAGAKPGDVLHGFGHSQGGMILERLALEGTYDTRTLVSFGSPVQADVGSDTLSVSVRHTDDPVIALQSGGHAGAVGAPGSFVVERVADPAVGLGDLHLPAHHLSEYTETAQQIDASTDPRVRALREVFDEWQQVDTVDATDYVATRVSPSRDGSGEG